MVRALLLDTHTHARTHTHTHPGRQAGRQAGRHARTHKHTHTHTHTHTLHTMALNMPPVYLKTRWLGFGNRAILVRLFEAGRARYDSESATFQRVFNSCQKDFPQLTAKVMNRQESTSLQPEADMTLCLTTSTLPRIDKLCATHQGQLSH